MNGLLLNKFLKDALVVAPGDGIVVGMDEYREYTVRIEPGAAPRNQKGNWIIPAFNLASERLSRSTPCDVFQMWGNHWVKI